ncbi:MAG: hypothetical protein M3Q53_00340 [Actinomycetota bacterium]|nr:hypothetical protein [Actinomycetota bacterium]
MTPQRWRLRLGAGHLCRAEAEQLELAPGQIVWARPRHARVFENGGGPQTAELPLDQA